MPRHRPPPPPRARASTAVDLTDPAALTDPSDDVDDTVSDVEGEAALHRALDRGGAGPSLADLGWDDRWEAAAAAIGRDDTVPARVAVEHRGRLVVVGPEGSRLGFAPQGAQHDSTDPDAALQRPRVGDWVLVPPGDTPRVAALLPRRTALLRQVPRRRVAVQVVAANLDLVVVVAAFGNELNVRRIERYLAAAEASGAARLVVVNKRDLAPPGADPAAGLAATLGASVPVVALSAHDGDGIDALRAHMGPGHTIGLVGSSGVGKSSLANALLGRSELAVGAVRADDEKGRHTTTHRELVVLPAGLDGRSAGVLIDTPGMRELQLWDGSGVDRSFDDLHAIAARCRFRGCTHTREAGCALLNDIEDGVLEPGRLGSYRKLMAEVRAKDEAARRRRDPRRAAPDRWHPRDWQPDEG